MSYRKVGGLHFITIGRLGFCWYWRRKRNTIVVNINRDDIPDHVYAAALDYGIKTVLDKERAHV